MENAAHRFLTCPTCQECQVQAWSAGSSSHSPQGDGWMMGSGGMVMTARPPLTIWAVVSGMYGWVDRRSEWEGGQDTRMHRHNKHQLSHHQPQHSSNGVVSQSNTAMPYASQTALSNVICTLHAHHSNQPVSPTTHLPALPVQRISVQAGQELITPRHSRLQEETRLCRVSVTAH